MLIRAAVFWMFIRMSIRTKPQALGHTEGWREGQFRCSWSSTMAPFAEAARKRCHVPLLQRRHEKGHGVAQSQCCPCRRGSHRGSTRAWSMCHTSAEAGQGATCCASTSHSCACSRPGPRSPPTHQWVGGRASAKNQRLRSRHCSGQQWLQQQGDGGNAFP